MYMQYESAYAKVELKRGLGVTTLGKGAAPSWADAHPQISLNGKAEMQESIELQGEACVWYGVLRWLHSQAFTVQSNHCGTP
jgi:hypothetical protein